ncbi:MAG TPA: response regulator [Azospirillaceae bacterium]|nr:response regulator [Azospirillaceae bacterium]
MRRCPDLAGLRILVVEDEVLVAINLELLLEEIGCTVAATAHRVAPALETVAALGGTEDAPDIAVLDVNIAGEMVFPVADALADRGIPFLFATGYGRAVLAGAGERHADCPVLQKPYSRLQLATALRDALGRGGPAGDG